VTQADGIEAIDNGQRTMDSVVYDLQGRKVNGQKKGIGIMRMEDGTVIKRWFPVN